MPLLILALASCGKDDASAPRRIERLDLSVDSAGVDALAAWEEIIGADYAGSPAVRAFSPIVRGQLPALDSVENVLGHALKGNDGIRLVGVVSPYNQAVVTHPDGYVFIALNHYLGADNPIYAGRFAEYERQRKTLRRLPTDVMEAVLAQKYPAEYGDSPTLLNHMLYRGALLRAVLELMPENTPEYTVLGMTEHDYNQCVANEAQIWRVLVEGKMLYSTDRTLIDRLLSPAPSSPLISADAPGQAVLFTALQIAKRSDYKAIELLKPEYYNNNQSLIDSQYAPR